MAGAMLAMTPVLRCATPDVPEAVRFFAPWFLPKVMQDTYGIKEYLCSDEFALLRRERGDPAAVDALYAQALQLSWGNSGEALFLCLMATMEHRRVEVTLPVIGLVIPVPLTGEFEDEFARRLPAIPSAIYADSPRTADGDRDKLQHFFASAFLVVATESAEGVDAMGYFVERGESRYVAGERVDLRDIRANRQGQRFGAAVLAGLDARPSEYLRSEEVTP
jgi:hypothetical protein